MFSPEGAGNGRAGAATSLNSTFRRVAGGIGSQIGALLLAAIVLHPHVPRNAAFVLAFAIGALLAAAGACAAVAIRTRDR